MLAVTAAVGDLGACGDDDDGWTATRRIPVEQATALAVAPDGTLLAGELLTGEILEIDLVTGDRSPLTVVEPLDTSPSQRGLLSMAVTGDGSVLAAFVNGGNRLEVAEIETDGAVTSRWIGPEARDEANGGRLVVLPDGRVVIGIGDLLEPELVDDPDAPNGKLLEIDLTDPESGAGGGVGGAVGGGAPLAGGFNNPFAMATADDGTIWVADNAPGAQPERLLRIDPGGEVDTVTEWTDTRVPVGVAVTTDGLLALCNYATTELHLVDPDDPGDGLGELVADDCRYGVVALADGGLAYAGEDDVVVLAPPA